MNTIHNIHALKMNTCVCARSVAQACPNLCDPTWTVACPGSLTRPHVKNDSAIWHL